jgi:hypothetical protein
MTRVQRGLAVLTALVMLTALLALAATPTGASTPEAALPRDARISARRDAGSSVVFLTVLHGELSVVVAYHRAKGWFAATAPSVPRGVDVAVTGTSGDDPVPALTAAYGRADGPTVRITWADGRTDTATVGTDGLWLSVRDREVDLTKVDVLAAGGAIVASQDAP